MPEQVGSTSGVSVIFEPEQGGRWTSLRGPLGREWLWRRELAEADRLAARPGDPFIDAGGLEECCPTIAGAFDHGDNWSQPWSDEGNGNFAVTGHGYRLSRRISIVASAIVSDYQLEAEEGLRFIWAGHSSLDLSEAAQIIAPEGHRTRVWPEHWRTWPNTEQIEGPWPAPIGVPLDELRSDGTATFCMLLDLTSITARDGDAEIRFQLDAPGQPVAIALWRNLGAWPADTPYRSIAIEPAIGWHFDRDHVEPPEVGLVPACGEVTWRLTISATA